MLRLAVFGKWSENNGYDSDDSQENIDFMKKNHFVYWDENGDSDDSDDRDDRDDRDDSDQELSIIDNINYIKCQFEDCPYDYEIDIINSTFKFNDRLFAVKHSGIETLQKKWKSYYNEKLLFNKSFKNLRFREIFGKYNHNTTN